MKRIFNYLVCSVALFVGVALMACGTLWMAVASLMWFAMCYVWGEVFPVFWKRFWIQNMRILAYFNCL